MRADHLASLLRLVRSFGGVSASAGQEPVLEPWAGGLWKSLGTVPLQREWRGRLPLVSVQAGAELLV